MKPHIDHIDTELGLLEITASDTAIVSVYFVETAQPVDGNPMTELAKTQLTFGRSLWQLNEKLGESEIPLFSPYAPASPPHLRCWHGEDGFGL